MLLSLVNTRNEPFGAGKTIVQPASTDPGIIGKIIPPAQLGPAAGLDFDFSMNQDIVGRPQVPVPERCFEIG